MRTCGACSRTTRKVGEAMLSPSGYFLDQIIVCRYCEWTGVETRTLTEKEAEKFRVMAARPKQLRLL